MIYKTGTIKAVEGTKVLIEVDMGKDTYLIEKQHIEDCEIAFADGRKISVKQRKYIYSLIRDIAKSIGFENEPMKEAMKSQFCLSTGRKEFSLSDIDMSTATDFLEYLVNFCIEHEIETSLPLHSVYEQTWKFVYACCMNKKCCIYGVPGHIYNVETLSTEIKEGDLVYPLSDKAAMALQQYGKDDFSTVNFIDPIPADEQIVRVAQQDMGAMLENVQQDNIA